MNPPDVSILIPVCNSGSFLRECLAYALAQTMRNIEVICVNDASADNSLAILREYEAHDSRLKVIDLQENSGILVARKTAAMAAKGRYSVYCDPEIFLAREACEELSTLIQTQDCDALSFSANIIENTKLTVPGICPGSAKIENSVLLNTLSRQKDAFRGTLRGIFIKTDILQKAFSLYPDVHLCAAADTLVLISLLALCRTWCGTQKKYYNIHQGPDTVFKSARDVATAQKNLNDIGQHKKIYEEILPHLSSDSISKELLQKLIDKVLTELYRHAFSVQICKFPGSYRDKGALLHDFILTIDRRLFVQAIADSYLKFIVPYDQLKMWDESRLLQAPKFKANELKTIAIYHERYTMGGMERYISCVIPLFIKMGFRVLLLTDLTHPGQELEIPESVTRYVLTKKPEERAKKLIEILDREKVDIYYIQHHSAFPDILICKLLFNIPVIAHWHTNFTRFIRTAGDFYETLCLQHKFCDVTISLSDAAAVYYRTNGVKSKYLMNIQAFTASSVPSHSCNRPLKTILWLARLDVAVKQPRAAVQIMQEVVKTVPDAKMLIVGGPTPLNPKEPKILAKMIRDAGLENNITLCGEQLDVESYYRQADVFLMTSAIDGLGNTIYEASAHGLPVVMYDLPYIAYHSYTNGIISVPMNDKNAAAEAICRILQNEEEHRELSARSRKMAEDISAIDFEHEWREIFAALERGGEEFLHIGEEHQRALRVMMETLREHTIQGINTRVNALNGEINRLKKNQASWLVRKFRGGVQCVKDNGIRYTVKHFFEKVKGKLSRRKGTA